jgi:hypothetical protein
LAWVDTVRLGYRLRQLWWQLRSSPLPESAWSEITAVLSEPERVLFDRFRPSDQWHSYRVFVMLREAGHWQSDLLKAALLHDVGKTCVRLTIWDRTLIVVLGGLMSERTAEWGQESGDLRLESGEWWRRPFVVKEQHPAWGATMVEAAGGSPLLVSLVRRHQDKLPGQPASTEEQLLAYLQWADDQN